MNGQSPEDRCEVCNWPLTTNPAGCQPGNCSYRPAEGSDEYYRIKRRREQLREAGECRCGIEGSHPLKMDCGPRMDERTICPYCLLPISDVTPLALGHYCPRCGKDVYPDAAGSPARRRAHELLDKWIDEAERGEWTWAGSPRHRLADQVHLIYETASGALRAERHAEESEDSRVLDDLEQDRWEEGEQATRDAAEDSRGTK